MFLVDQETAIQHIQWVSLGTPSPPSLDFDVPSEISASVFVLRVLKSVVFVLGGFLLEGRRSMLIVMIVLSSIDWSPPRGGRVSLPTSRNYESS